MALARKIMTLSDTIHSNCQCRELVWTVYAHAVSPWQKNFWLKHLGHFLFNIFRPLLSAFFPSAFYYPHFSIRIRYPVRVLQTPQRICCRCLQSSLYFISFCTYANEKLEIRVSQNLAKARGGGEEPIRGGRAGEKWSKSCNWGGRV